MDENFHAVELDVVIWFSTHSRVSWLLWHSSRWVQCFSHFLQYTSGLEMLACTFDTNFDYVSTTIQLFPSLNLWVVKLEQVLKGRQISELSFQLYFQWQIRNPSSALFFTRGSLLNFQVKCLNFWEPKLNILQLWGFLCCHYIGPYITCLTVSFNTVKCGHPSILIFCVFIVLSSNPFGRI